MASRKKFLKRAVVPVKINAKADVADLVKRIVSPACRAGVPVYRPAVAGSSIAIALALKNGTDHLIFDIIGDDAPHWGGLSGFTFEEARSWGKTRVTKRIWE